ncbi:flavin reductase family protein [Anaerosacchariphilus polymeriproducens]|uniref:Flavin reductase family protein n=1 Tax=Anaerosacchariphilus polymeriproducens TaxID=1812858 RepID=A0A371AZV1_9FIRM|nr:flavin reductase family protein [Anaerosacchariphilus polymeriproducens]RDU25091.1 flavin reductase family protein [Anaerosacchariphilus polymeriproducens]
MKKQIWKPGNMLYPLPSVMVSCADKSGNKNILTVAWTGTICTNPPMLYISVRPERYSYHMIKQTEQFVVNLTTKKLVRAADFCGVKSGKNIDKFKEMKLTAASADKLEYAPIIAESPVNIECKVTELKELGSHHMFIAEVVSVQVSEEYMNKNNKFELNQSDLVAYSHGEYFVLEKSLGNFGYSIRKNTIKSKKVRKKGLRKKNS